jgi:hypothetical protein
MPRIAWCVSVFALMAPAFALGAVDLVPPINQPPGMYCNLELRKVEDSGESQLLRESSYSTVGLGAASKAGPPKPGSSVFYHEGSSSLPGLRGDKDYDQYLVLSYRFAGDPSPERFSVEVYRRVGTVFSHYPDSGALKAGDVDDVLLERFTVRGNTRAEVSFDDYKLNARCVAEKPKP